MSLSQSKLFSVEDLKNAVDGKGNWFGEHRPPALAGRCLLDTIEYIRTQRESSGQFMQVKNAHAIRLTVVCLSPGGGLNLPGMFAQMKPYLVSACRDLLESRGNSFPPYGDDFWDWASVMECFMEVSRHFPNDPISERELNHEMEDFKSAIEENLERNKLFLGEVKDEWYGPATATVAYRVLESWSKEKHLNLNQLLAQLKRLALEPIDKIGELGEHDGEYNGEHVPKEHVIWHLGQVVAAFPVEADAQWQKAEQSLPGVAKFAAPAYKAYALARYIQGAIAKNDQEEVRNALNKVYPPILENQARWFGTGIIGDQVKASLNMLEALWGGLSRDNKARITEMLEALHEVRIETNSGLILVAIPNETEALIKAFKLQNANVGADLKKSSASTPEQARAFFIRHSNYRVVVGQGKSLMEASNIALDLLKRHQPEWVIMIGVAGSLGTIKNGKFTGPYVGDIVIATSLAPYGIREKVRSGIVENSDVKYISEWKIIPTDPYLFMHAHLLAKNNFPEDHSRGRVWEGQIVTGNGIKDDLEKKDQILAEFPGALAVEEEGYPVALVSMLHKTPCIVIRGISDLAQGDKKATDELGRSQENTNQGQAAERVSRLVVQMVEQLSSL